jgi:hypothetical protein
MEPLHVSMPHELKSCPSTSPTHPGQKVEMFEICTHHASRVRCLGVGVGGRGRGRGHGRIHSRTDCKNPSTGPGQTESIPEKD